ncbi:hypothetical protein [Jonesia quinghaiensis]|uniref:hypothetical protein n=1 Tax=Jonesia quinghaiensis TaxID=262806 RepID=UPI000491FD4C|nr:hypothetical protein [Jonesia quinghaiensis]
MREGSGFTSQQWLDGLLPEVDSARSVLASADRLLRQEGTLGRDLDAVLATYPIGVERLMKLALGTAAVSKGEGWPKKMGFTHEGWGHALDEMDERLRSGLREAIESGDWERKRMLRSWICTLDNDPVWAAVVRTLRNYADAGRYHHLDQISGKDVTSRSSRAMWDEVEQAAIASSPSLTAHRQRTLDGADFAPFERELRAAVADSIKRWVSIVCLFGFHGVLGEDWRVIGASALPDDALLVRALPDCEAQA